MSSLGVRLKQIRLEKNLTVRELAQRAGVSVSYIYAIESGTRGFNIVKLQQLADALEVPLAELWGGTTATRPSRQ
ncbi:MAG: helix-turn-helix transcriptional regulator [Alicyclobacillus sp.]|nr:helix-turn-helix transcriptional regulator [Alicyclobacillus sp.]